MAPSTTNTTLKCRVATPQDAPALQRLIQAAFRAEDSRPDWTADMALGSTFEMPLAAVEARIASTESVILVFSDAAADAEPPLGCVALTKTSPDLARLSWLAVDTSRQLGGLGRQVVSAAEDHCRRAWGCRTCGLDALSTRASLMAWYERCGYRRTGETSPFPAELSGGLDLWFVEFEKKLDETPLD